jgi:hypothetical protein
MLRMSLKHHSLFWKIASGVLSEEDICKTARLRNTTIIQHQTDSSAQQVERLLNTATRSKRNSAAQTPVSIPSLVSQAVKKIQPLADDKKPALI